VFLSHVQEGMDDAQGLEKKKKNVGTVARGGEKGKKRKADASRTRGPRPAKTV